MWLNSTFVEKTSVSILWSALCIGLLLPLPRGPVEGHVEKAASTIVPGLKAENLASIIENQEDYFTSLGLLCIFRITCAH